MQRLTSWGVVGATVVGCLVFASGLGAQEHPTPPGQEATAPVPIQDNMTVQLDYTLTVEGNLIDSTEGRDPFRYVHGKGEIIPGLERQLNGLRVGDTREITVSPEEGYGPLDPSAVVDVPKEQLPPDVSPEVGLILRGTDPDGRPFRATISQVKDQTVTLNLNHPLAGKTLLFKIKVVAVSPAQ